MMSACPGRSTGVDPDDSLLSGAGADEIRGPLGSAEGCP
ncbi:hypothetical protein [Streptomyces sp. NPDC047829]